MNFVPCQLRRLDHQLRSPTEPSSCELRYFLLQIDVPAWHAVRFTCQASKSIRIRRKSVRARVRDVNHGLHGHEEGQVQQRARTDCGEPDLEEHHSIERARGPGFRSVPGTPIFFCFGSKNVQWNPGKCSTFGLRVEIRSLYQWI